MAEAIIIGEMFDSLAGRKMNYKERETQICLGVLTALFDILVYDNKISAKTMKAILKDTFIYRAA